MIYRDQLQMIEDDAREFQQDWWEQEAAELPCGGCLEAGCEHCGIPSLDELYGPAR